MTFDEWIATNPGYMPGCRTGQAYCNSLSEVRPELARNIVATVADPFYSNSRISTFLTYVAENWDAGPEQLAITKPRPW